MITVRRERRQRRIVVVISGAVDADGVPSLGRALVRALRTRAPILIDLTQATSIHNDALATLLAAHRRAERAGTQLLIRADPTQVRDVVDALGIPSEDRRR